MQYQHYDIVAIVHRLFRDGHRKRGGFDKILDYMALQGKSILLIEHPLRGLQDNHDGDWNCAIISEVRQSGIVELERISRPVLPGPLQWIGEVLFNISLLQSLPEKPVLFAADPLSGLAGVFGKKYLLRFYLHIVDFSKQRFKNVLLNAFYASAIWLCLKRADLVSVVSTRTKQALGHNPVVDKKIVYVPNSPVFREISIENKEGRSLVYAAAEILGRYKYDFVIDLLALVRNKMPDVVLYAVGTMVDVAYVAELKQKIKELGLEKNIVFTGFLGPDALDTLLRKATIGLSFYNKTSLYFTYFGDSLKIREYALYGIPCISDGNSSTDEEMTQSGAGFIVSDIASGYDTICRILENPEVLATAQQSAFVWAKAMDKNIILKNLYERIFG